MVFNHLLFFIGKTYISEAKLEKKNPGRYLFSIIFLMCTKEQSEICKDARRSEHVKWPPLLFCYDSTRVLELIPGSRSLFLVGKCSCLKTFVG
jgi:hypothetical protein